MSNEQVATATTTQTEAKEKTIHDPDISFADFERLQNGEKVSVSADEANAEQKDETTENSEVSEKPEQDESEVEAQDNEEENESDEDESEEQEERAPKKKNGVQKRIGKLKNKLTEREQRIAFLEGQLAAAQGKKPQQEAEAQTEQTEQTLKEPDPNDFTTNAEYLKALFKYDKDLSKQEADKKAAESQRASELKTLDDQYNARADEYVKKDPEFIEVVQEFLEEHGDLPFSVTAERLIKESDIGPQIAKELFKDKKEFDRINSLGYKAAVREIGKIEDRLLAKSQDSQSTKPKEKKLTTASAPIAPIGNKGAASVKKSIHDPDLSFEDFERLENERLKRKQG